jgi:hypothetical protein
MSFHAGQEEKLAPLVVDMTQTHTKRIGTYGGTGTAQLVIIRHLISTSPENICHHCSCNASWLVLIFLKIEAHGRWLPTTAN